MTEAANVGVSRRWLEDGAVRYRGTEDVLAGLADVPTPVWGRDASGTGETWNSNSVI